MAIARILDMASFSFACYDTSVEPAVASAIGSETDKKKKKKKEKRVVIAHSARLHRQTRVFAFPEKLRKHTASMLTVR